MTQEHIMALPKFQDSELFTPAEKAALKFADVIAGNHFSVTQELFDELRQFYTDRQIMALGWRMATFTGYGRLVYALGLEDVGEICTLDHGKTT